MPEAELLPFGDAGVLRHLLGRCVLLEAGRPKALSIPGAEWLGIQTPCTLRLQTARTNLIISNYL